MTTAPFPTLPPRRPTRSYLPLPGWIDPDTFLAALYKPLLPALKKMTKGRRSGPRGHNPKDVLVPDGFAVEVVATGFTTPVHCCFDDQGTCYVVECGHKSEARPRILKVDLRTGRYETYLELPEDRWVKTGAVTGACWRDGTLYVTNTDHVFRVTPDKRIEDVVTGLPGRGDHQTNYPVLGPDGKLYWGQGSVTNGGVVGAENFAYEWLPKFPHTHDVPGGDVTLAGRNYEYPNVLGSVTERVRSGAYVPFGTETQPGQVIAGRAKCSGAILRCDPEGGAVVETVAWGLRNPYGIAFHPDGRLFATEHGLDERGGRYVVGDFDDFYEIKEGGWYGWPDFASGVRLDDPYWGPPGEGQGREPVLAEHPEPQPPAPFVVFEPHAASNGVDFCRDAAFGFEGDAFVALFGDLAPVTSPRMTRPAGFKVVRVDMRERQVVDFAVNRIDGPASKLPHEGFERPSHCAFGPDGALYIVDWGEIDIAPEVGGVRMQNGTGTLWRIRRTAPAGQPVGNRPPEPARLPFYALQYAAWLGGVAGVAGLTAVGAWLLRRAWRGAR